MNLPERARAWRREFLGRAALEGSARLVGWSLAALAALLWTDRLFSLPQGVRQACWLVAGVLLLAAVYAWVFGPWLRFDWGPVLDGACREFPELKDPKSGEPLMKVIRETLMHELAHYFGFSEEEMDAIEEGWMASGIGGNEDS